MSEVYRQHVQGDVTMTSEAQPKQIPPEANNNMQVSENCSVVNIYICLCIKVTLIINATNQSRSQ